MQNIKQNKKNNIISLSDFLRWAERLFIKNKLFFGHGTCSAWDEAVAIASYVLDIDLYQQQLLDQILTKSQINKLIKIANLRADTKQPLSYLIKTAWFAGKKYYVDRRVIIPRSPIAELIQHKFKPWITKKPKRILDLCTGSGCIAIACFHRFNTEVYGSDICAKALTVAKKNLTLHNLSEQKIKFIKSDLFKNIPKIKFDLIVSNPPYVDQKTFNKLPKEFHFEPTKALVGGTNGLELVTKILQTADNFLNTNGILIVEVGALWHKLVKMYPKTPFLWLDFHNGGEGVFLLTKAQLQEFKNYYANV